jgi:hypothetical protein
VLRLWPDRRVTIEDAWLRPPTAKVIPLRPRAH